MAKKNKNYEEYSPYMTEQEAAEAFRKRFGFTETELRDANQTRRYRLTDIVEDEIDRVANLALEAGMEWYRPNAIGDACDFFASVVRTHMEETSESPRRLAEKARELQEAIAKKKASRFD